MCKEICGIMSCSGHVKSSSLVFNPRQNCASASTGWVTKVRGNACFPYPALISMRVFCHVCKNGLGHRPLVWQLQKTKLTTQWFWLLSRHSHPSVFTCTYCFCSGRTAYGCRLQAGWMAEAGFRVRGLVRVLQKAIDPSVREGFLRCKAWKPCTSVPRVLRLL